jgi:two-component system sensor histidine kinase BaeS
VPRSLRFRLPALLLAGILLAGIVSAAIALLLFQRYTHGQSLKDLRQEADGLAQLYAEAAAKSNEPPFSVDKLELATGDRIYYKGLPLYPGRLREALPPLPPRYLNDWLSEPDRVRTFSFTSPTDGKRYIAVAHPVTLQGSTFGALVVATPATALRKGWVTLIGLLAVSLVGGILVAGALAWWLSRRITEPVLALSAATDQIARGNYAIAAPEARGAGEIEHLAERFGQMAEKLAEAEELERNFIMTVSHELRTPLTAIRGHVEALREGLAADPEARALSLDVIADEARRLERLVGDLLDLAKLEARRFTVHREEVDMGQLVDQAYSAFGEEARRRGIDYRREIGAQPVIVSDGDRVFQIVGNLLRNAFRWTPDGGTIELSLAQENGHVAVAIADSGPGITPEERDRIFRPFWTRDDGGTGLGLAIAKELAVALGGGVSLESEPGRGSRFELVLPAG